jgi:hypothetical protein
MLFEKEGDPDHSSVQLIRPSAPPVAVAMPDPSELSPEGPERPGESAHASVGLRRRVLARVRTEPEPIGSGALHAARRILGGGRRRGAFALLALTGSGVLAVSVLSLNGGSGTLGRAHLAQELGGAHASLHRVDGHAELRLAGMPPPPIGEVYEVWLSGPRAAARPTNALFNITSAGTAAVEVPGSLRGVREVTVTAEPVGGSLHPTSPVILSVALARAR